MAMNFEELEDVTRRYMLAEFEAEELGGKPYRGKVLSAIGCVEFPDLMRRTIRTGNEQTLITSLLVPSYWNPTESYVRQGVMRERHVNVQQTAERLGLTEFNTWYVRGLTKRFIEEGITLCQVYRAGIPRWEESAECKAHEGQVVSVEEIYRGHRARYWPEPGNTSTLSIPIGPNCHHTIKRTG